MSQHSEPIAIVGTGCRFPGESTNPSKLWQLLKEPRDVLRKIDRFKADNFYNQDGHHHGASNILHAYLLSEEVKNFDHQFFNIPLSEAEAIDPQQRLLMETVYESLESAGLSISSLSGSNTGVYVGVMCDDFNQIIFGDPENVPTYAATGSSRSILSNRISYFFNWRGPSMTIDTACSSSLIAVHQAVQVLRSGECPVAVAAGANLIFGPTMFIAESNLNMLSPHGRSRMWDASADGYARGEGIGAVVLKTLSAAIRDGDHIECIIRETGINQDGRTPGITMPSADSQADLIRDTYRRAGLDPTKALERCQYFEAHGTGTPAGDPQEASAIYKVFFESKDKQKALTAGDLGAVQLQQDDDLLYVGSVKTVIGHTEGTAGLAGLIKASLAMQNKTIPPNMHFNKLNPNIKPYYGNLKVPVRSQEWPELPVGVPRRCSVNSFGFGGANAHCIIESWDGATATIQESHEPEVYSAQLPARRSHVTAQKTAWPFVFSASSEKSLAAQLRSYLEFIDRDANVDLSSVSWSLFRRTALNFRIAFSATAFKALAVDVEKALGDFEAKKAPLGVRVNPKASKDILGVFTGQGAQWATMGKHLILASPIAAARIDELEQSLAALPDGPEWSLRDEIFAPPDVSRVGQAAISQPLCTAVQIMVVDLLHQAGVQFASVVGHSSGEIACAYVAGFLSGSDAIRIAYYRGKFAPLAKGGAMIAAGTDKQDAIDLCNLPKLNGRTQLAADNSSASVTISGDAEAIELVEVVMKDESKFARKLKVDTAYHSHHMRICSQPYLEALEKCDIRVLDPGPSAPGWYSSVAEDGQVVTASMARSLKSLYWHDNMLNRVNFAPALRAAVEATGCPGLALEVGPHPALQGPASLTIEEATGSAVPYFGTLNRGKNDALAISSTLGSIWTVLGSAGIDFQRFQRAFDPQATFTVSKSLPSIVWDHDKIVWSETRGSKTHRYRAHTPHELLGVRSHDECEGEMRWRNYLKPKEMPWLSGHKIQSQIVFPAAGFVVMALEAARNLAPLSNIRLMSIQDFVIYKALSFLDDNASVEVVFRLYNFAKTATSIEATFSCHACMGKESLKLELVADGRARLDLGYPTKDDLPQRAKWADNFVPTDCDFFYESLAGTGYGYTSMFQGITELWRTFDGSRGVITIPQDGESAVNNWLIHPATIDVAFQGIFAAVGAPGDGRLWTLFLPTIVKNITINPNATELTSCVEVPLPFDAHRIAQTFDDISGDIDVYDEDGQHAVLQIQGLHVSPIKKHSVEDDRETFYSMRWGPGLPDLTSDSVIPMLKGDAEKVAVFAERLALCILRDLCESVTQSDIDRNGSQQQRTIRAWAQHAIDLSTGRYSACRRNWLADSWDDLRGPAQRLISYSLVARVLKMKERLTLLFAAGSSVVVDEERATDSVEMLTDLRLLDSHHEHLVKVISQIAFRHVNMSVLEIGAGKGVATMAALGALKQNFRSYTFTDCDDSAFESVKAMIPADQLPRVSSKVLDIGEDLTDQDISTGTFDLVIASNALYTKSDLDLALRNVRSLLRPGGFLVLLEPTNSSSLAVSLCGAMNDGWFDGIEEFRKHSPFVSQVQWDGLLRTAGFSGIDTATPEPSGLATPFSVMCSTAEDRQMASINNPLRNAAKEQFGTDLLIMGGQSIVTCRLVQDLTSALNPYFQKVLTVERFADLDDDIVAKNPTVISLVEIDEPVFKPFTQAKFKALVKLCDNLKKVLWVTQGSRGENPYASMMNAIGRCLLGEVPTLRMRFLNFDSSDTPSAGIVAHHLLQLQLTLHLTGEPGKAGEPLLTIEREMTISHGKLMFQRYLPAHAINDRLNSERRFISRQVDQGRAVVRASWDSGVYELTQLAPLVVEEPLNRLITARKSHLAAVRVEPAGCAHVVVGHDASGQKVIALSDRLESIISVASGLAIPTNVAGAKEASLLRNVAYELVASSLLRGTTGTVLVHEPSEALAASLKALASDLGKTLIITSSNRLGGATQLHPSTPERIIRRAIPSSTSIFADLSQSSGSVQDTTLQTRIVKLLPFGCRIWETSDLFSREGFTITPFEPAVFQQAVARSRSYIAMGMSTSEPVPASSLTSEQTTNFSSAVVDWQVDHSLPVTMDPAEDMVKFRGDRTYLLVGLTGQLGLHLARWMVHRGARYFALSSRNPRVDEEWLQDIQSLGATVKTYAMDVTNRASVHASCKLMAAEMPPMAGVANGAMILIDGLLANKTFADFEKTLRPKVDGTVYLDEVFSEDTLDFFIVFSSLACISGNVGQSAYASANQFMCSLVSGRRMRGLAGSSINMPGIVGLGYLNRDVRKLDRLKSSGYANISEWDFYQFFAEAVLAGRPESGSEFDISAGLTRIELERMGDDLNLVLWNKDARFDPLRKVSMERGEEVSNQASSVSVRAQLAEMTTESDVHDLLLEGLLATLYARLNMNPEERGITPDTAIVEMGVDSLLAVDMRAWFTKELDLDMPVLKLLGGATVRDLVEDAVKRLSPALTPKLCRDGDDPTAQPTDEDANDEAAPSNDEKDGQTVSEDVTTDSSEEVAMIVEPLDLPSTYYDNPEPDADCNEEVAWSSLEPTSTHIGSSVEASSADVRTPATSLSSRGSEADDMHNKDEETRPKGVAKLFSPLPDYTEEVPKFVKKVPMSYGASRFWLLSQYVQDPTVFNLVSHFRLNGKVNVQEGKRCIREFGLRHEVFHTAFFADPDNLNEPTMGIMEDTRLHLEYRDHATEADFEAEMEELLRYDFKLTQGEVFRFKCISLDEHTHYVLFGFHHIAMDGFSYNTLLSDINMLYDRAPAAPIACQYSDFAVRQRTQVQDGTLDDDFQFWKDMYSVKLESGEVKDDFPELLPLFKMARSTRQPLDDYDYEEVKITLDTRTARQIKAQCRRHKITTFHFFLGVLRTFLFRHLDVDDLSIGIADANRIDADVQDTIGFMLNLLPLRFRRGDDDATFQTIASSVRDTVYQALSHSKLPFDALLERLDIPRSSTHSPLFQAWMDYKVFRPGYRPTLFGGEITGAASVGKNGYDLTLDIDEADRYEINVSLRMQKYLYSKQATQTLMDSYLKLVKTFAAEFETPISSAGLWEANMIEAATELGRGPVLASTWPETIPERIAIAATVHADAVAVKDGNGKTHTYRDLQDRVQAISECLHDVGVKQGSRVAVFQQPSADWITSMLGIWHAGATYVPLDMRDPIERLVTIVGSAKPRVILFHDDTDADVWRLGFDGAVINVSQLPLAPKGAHLATQAKASTPAAVLFTSGSTGVPKGIIISHGALRNTFEGLTRHYDLGAERVLQQSAYTFDFSLDQILVGLVNGGSVYVVSQQDRLDPVAISKIIVTEKVTYTRATPTEYINWITYGADMLQHASAWTRAFAGGEMLPHSLRHSLDALHLSDLRLFNSYGPAETVTCTKIQVPYNEVDEDDVHDIPVGFPLPNYTIYIVDSHLDLVPQGVSGEIVIGGPSVGLGYLNNEKLSDTKFVNIVEGAGIVYRTGDVGYLREDGVLMFQGRIAGDLQVKIRGMRVDLQDVESCILTAAQGALDTAIVTVREGEMLVAHVRPAAGFFDDESEQKAFLRSLRLMLPLPAHAVPGVIIPVEKMPTNSHGKVDRVAVRALPLPQSSQKRALEALTGTEEKLLQVWKECGLSHSEGAVDVDSQTTFFEMGGNSILLVKLQILISMRFNVKLTLLDLFNAVSLNAMAAKIESTPQVDGIDWDKETALDPNLISKTAQSSAITNPAQHPARRILITGASGFLGRRLVQTLAGMETTTELHLVAVRSQEAGADLTTMSDKVTVHEGDLAAPRLGLSATQFDELAAKTDLIIHAGVSRSSIDSYQSLAGANLRSTKTLVEMAAGRHIPVHYISTGSISSFGRDGSPPASGALGYSATKWASEKYLENASSQVRLPVVVHRIVPAAETNQSSTDQVIAHIKSVSAKLSSTPTFQGLNDVCVDFIRLDGLLGAIDISMQRERADDGLPFIVQEHVCDAQISFSERVQQEIEEADGGVVRARKIPFPRWAARARKAGLLEWQIASMDFFPLEV